MNTDAHGWRGAQGGVVSAVRDGRANDPHNKREAQHEDRGATTMQPADQ